MSEQGALLSYVQLFQLRTCRVKIISRLDDDEDPRFYKLCLMSHKKLDSIKT